MPLDQQSKGGHGKGEPCVEILPHTVHHLFVMAHDRQHRQNRLDEDAILPLAALTQFEVAGIPLGSMKGGITQVIQTSVKVSKQTLFPNTPDFRSTANGP